MKCEKCGAKHNGTFATGRFCSRQCANSRTWSKADKKKKSESARSSLKVLKANRLIGKSLRGRTTAGFEKLCPICKKAFRAFEKHEHIFCSMKCCREDTEYRYRKKLGGYRVGSGRGKSGWFSGIRCDSSWELAYVIYCHDHGIEIERNKQSFEYEFDGKKRKYIPDFLVSGQLVEIKGYVTKQWKAKLAQFKQPIEVLYKKEMKPILEYVTQKYGHDFLRLYTGNPHNEKTNICLECGEVSRNTYCDRSCAMKGNWKKRRKRKSRSSNS